MSMQRVDTGKLTSFLTKGRTVAEVAEKFTVTKATANKYIKALMGQSVVAQAGVKNTGQRGRPAALYASTSDAGATA